MPKGSQNLVNKYAEQRGTIKKIKRKENYKQKIETSQKFRSR